MRAVILAGGKGTRLAPYTVAFPKPLMPLGDVPILEIVLRRLAAAGFDRVVLALGHMAPLITAFFQSVLAAGDDSTVTTVKAIVERVPEFLA